MSSAYTVQTIKSTVNTNFTGDLPSTGMAIVYRISKIEIIMDGEIPNYQKENDMLAMRIFNENEEYYCYKQNDKWKVRYRKDMEGTGTDCIDTKMKLRGKFATLTELGENVYIKTRNYISENEFGYDDFRVMGFVNLNATK